jgi:hypothetical protein
VLIAAACLAATALTATSNADETRPKPGNAAACGTHCSAGNRPAFSFFQNSAAPTNPSAVCIGGYRWITNPMSKSGASQATVPVRCK